MPWSLISTGKFSCSGYFDHFLFEITFSYLDNVIEIADVEVQFYHSVFNSGDHPVLSISAPVWNSPVCVARFRDDLFEEHNLLI
jgi:hypothetical protein